MDRVDFRVLACSPNDRGARGRARSLGSLLLAIALLIAITPAFSWACACGCDVFQVGTSSLIPRGMGGTIFFTYDFSDQHENWHDDHKAPKADNDDKIVRSHFFSIGAQYMFSRSWGVMAELPYTQRYFKTVDEDTGDLGRFSHSAIGDVRVEAMYTGFSDDMTTGVLSGIKFASGDFTNKNFDRDTSIGSGSTDLLLDGYHLGKLPLVWRDRSFHWYGQANLQQPIWTQDHYQPGTAFNVALGALYDFGQVGVLDGIAPILTMINSFRSSDHGSNADTDNTGYERIFLAPGAEVRKGPVRFYADIEFPVFQHVTGNQVVAPFLLKTVLSYDF